MENDAKFLIAAYQKKSFDLFNQVIATEARVQQMNEVIEAQTAKIKEFLEANKRLAEEVEILQNHITETQIQKKSTPPQTKTVMRKTKKVPPKSSVVIQDGGEF